MGPRQPIGFIPSSLYKLIISWDTFSRSFPCFLWISLIWGCKRDMARVALICFRVKGYMSSLMTIVKAMILSPKLLPSIT